MMDADRLGRTLKLELDEGRADSMEEAADIVATYRLGISAPPGFEVQRSSTAAVLTAIATGKRAFPGGVWLAAEGDPIVTQGWGRGRPLSEVAAELGVQLVRALPDSLPQTIVIGEPRDDRPALYATWHGWSGGVVLDPADRLVDDDDQPLSAVLAGAIAVSEAFQAMRGFVLAGRRIVGMSLWRPDLPWRHPDAVGPALEHLPAKLWLLGLGQLGQAFAWSLGWLPFEQPGEVLVGLVDPETIGPANVDTGLLTRATDEGRTKARIVAAALESLGIKTRIVERRFDKGFRPFGDEPTLAFAGFDDPQPRRLLEEAGFLRSVDAGVGAGLPQYLEGVIHAFPSSVDAREAFPDRGDQAVAVANVLAKPAYQNERARREAEGAVVDPGCGVDQIAGRSVGAAFVGAVASTLGLAEEIRAIAGGPQYEVVGFSLRTGLVEAVPNADPGPPRNPGFLSAGRAANAS